MPFFLATFGYHLYLLPFMLICRLPVPLMIPPPLPRFRSRGWQVNVFLTYMGDRYLELEDVDNVHLKLHPLVYTNKTWSPRKLLFRMRRAVILDVLSQVCWWA